jgi:hypothetical protein
MVLFGAEGPQTKPLVKFVREIAVLVVPVEHLWRAPAVACGHSHFCVVPRQLLLRYRVERKSVALGSSETRLVSLYFYYIPWDALSIPQSYNPIITGFLGRR